MKAWSVGGPGGGFGSFGSGGGGGGGSLAFFSEQVDKLHGELTAAQAELRDRKNAFRLTGGDADRSSIAEKTAAALRQKMYDLKLQESELKSRYTDEYPPLKDIRRQQAEVSNALTRVAGGQVASTSEATADQAANSAEDSGGDVVALNNQAFELAQQLVRWFDASQTCSAAGGCATA